MKCCARNAFRGSIDAKRFRASKVNSQVREGVRGLRELRSSGCRGFSCVRGSRIKGLGDLRKGYYYRFKMI